MNSSSIGEQINKARQKKNLTQLELSHKCHMDIRTIQRIEKGEVKPRAYTLRILNDALGTDFTVGEVGLINENLSEYRRIFRKRKNIRKYGFISALVFLILVGFYIIFIEKYINIPRLAWAPFVYLIMFGYIAVIAVTWRCPGCGGLLGDVFNTRYCSKCGLAFYE